MESIKLYKRTHGGALQYWAIKSVGYTLFIEYGLVDGAIQIQREDVRYGVGGRSQEEQVRSRMQSRASKKIDAGYVSDPDMAMVKENTNTLGLPKPMLATPLDKVPSTDLTRDGVVMQYKYDGHRCLISGTSAYSRNGKPITTIHEILHEVALIGVPDGCVLDGELYLHGTPLQTITSLAKRRQVRTADLTYVVYDIITPEPMVYANRLLRLNGMNFIPGGKVVLAEMMKVTHLPTDLNDAIRDGYEGLIIRLPGKAYDDGKRSKSLIKVKQFKDDEFTITDVVESREGYAIFVCDAENGAQFRVTAPGEMDEKFAIACCPEDYIGKMVNVQYAGLTKSGIPFHPVATMMRDKAAE